MILNESSRDNLLLPYLELLNAKGVKCTLSQLKQFLLAKFVNEAHIRNLSLESNYYLAGVAKYYFHGDLTTNKILNAFNSNVKDVFDTDICQKLNILILALRNSYIDSVGTTFEQPEDFGELSLPKLLRKYNKIICKGMGIEVPVKHKEVVDNLDRNNRVGNGYTFDILYSYEEAKKYNQYTEPGAWCITYGEHHYNSYIRNLGIHYVIFRKDGFENVERKKTEGWTTRKPQDEYGNSLIAVLQKNNSWEPVYITSRWNHGSNMDNSQCEADHAYTTAEFMRITGVSQADLERISKIWQKDREVRKVEMSDERKALNKEMKDVLRLVKYAQIRMNGGNFDKAFDEEFKFKQVKVLSNYQRLDNLRQAAQTALENGKDVTQYETSYKKTVRDSIRACQITYNNSTYIFLIDKNKILFETLYRLNGTYDGISHHFETSEDKEYSSWNAARHFKNIVLCSFPNSSMLYDTRRHCFVDVDGVKKFKYVTDMTYSGKIEDNDSGYYEVKMSQNVTAWIDWNTNKPLVLPNGSSWFEYAITNSGFWYKSNREVRTNFAGNKDGAAYIVYDSSANETYFYDLNTKRFFQPETDEENKIFEYNPFEITDNMPKDYYVIRYHKSKEIYYQFLYAIYHDGKPLSYEGNKLFSTVDSLGNGFLYFVTKGKPVLYNVLENKNYPFPINFTMVNQNWQKNKHFSLFRIFYNNQTKDAKVIVFSQANKCFIKNPFTNDFVFKTHFSYQIYTDSMKFEFGRNRYILKYNTATSKFVMEPDGTVDDSEINENKNNIMNKVIKINEDTIKQIVTESVKRVLKSNLSEMFVNEKKKNISDNKLTK